MSRQHDVQGHPTDSRIARTTRHSDRPVFEALEQRVLLSASQVGAELTLTGTAGDDTIAVTAGAHPGQVVVTGVDGVVDGTTYSGVDQVSIFALDGANSVTIGSDILSTAFAFDRFRSRRGSRRRYDHRRRW